MLKAILTIIGLLTSPTGDACDVHASDLVIDFSDGGILVVDATTGDELDGTICVERGTEFATTGAEIELLVGGVTLGTDGPLDEEGEMCITVDDQLTCACVDVNNVGWSQQCGGGISCIQCCFDHGGKTRRPVAMMLTPPPAGE